MKETQLDFSRSVPTNFTDFIDNLEDLSHLRKMAMVYPYLVIVEFAYFDLFAEVVILSCETFTKTCFT